MSIQQQIQYRANASALPVLAFARPIVVPTSPTPTSPDGSRYAQAGRASLAGGGSAPTTKQADPRLLKQGDKAIYWAGGGAVVGALAGYFLGGRSVVGAGLGAAALGAGAYLVAV